MKLFLRRLATKLVQFCRGIKQTNRKRLGEVGEIHACRYLKKHRYNILARNYVTYLGELDIVAEDGDTIVFVEVRTKRSVEYGLPEESIDKKKRQKLTRLAQVYIKHKHLYARKARFDVISIVAHGLLGRKSIRLIKNAFDEEE
jgi:putative endonuclease